METESIMSKDDTKILKGIAILFILLGHMNYFTWGGAGGVIIFLIISGYGNYKSLTINGIKGYWQKKITSIWIPYIIVGVYDTFVFSLSKTPEIIATITGMYSPYVADKTMWYISYILIWLLFLYLPFVIAGMTHKSKWLERGLTIIIMILAVIVTNRLTVLGYWHSGAGVDLYVAAFPIGVLLAIMDDVKIPQRIRCIFLCLLLFVSAIIFTNKYQRETSQLLAFSMAVIPISLTMLTSERIQKWRISRPLKWLGNYSYSIYLIEGIVINFARKSLFGRLEYQPIIDAFSIGFILIVAFLFQQLNDIMRKRSSPM